jgi:hypothetical protein
VGDREGDATIHLANVPQSLLLFDMRIHVLQKSVPTFRSKGLPFPYAHSSMPDVEESDRGGGTDENERDLWPCIADHVSTLLP